MASTNKKSNTYCSVYGCSTFYSNVNDISFHSLPKENDKKVSWINKSGTTEMIDRRLAWILKLRMDKSNLKKTQIKICSKHFTKNDFILPGMLSIYYIYITNLDFIYIYSKCLCET